MLHLHGSGKEFESSTAHILRKPTHPAGFFMCFDSLLTHITHRILADYLAIIRLFAYILHVSLTVELIHSFPDDSN